MFRCNRISKADKQMLLSHSSDEMKMLARKIISVPPQEIIHQSDKTNLIAGSKP